MINKIKGRLKLVEKPQRGNNGKKAWAKVGFVIEEEGTYPKLIYMVAWDNLANEITTWNIGDMVELNINIESREFNGKWYNNVTAVQGFNHYGN